MLSICTTQMESFFIWLLYLLFGEIISLITGKLISFYQRLHFYTIEMAINNNRWCRYAI